jgi:hypothetical protein
MAPSDRRSSDMYVRTLFALVSDVSPSLESAICKSSVVTGRRRWRARKHAASTTLLRAGASGSISTGPTTLIRTRTRWLSSPTASSDGDASSGDDLSGLSSTCTAEDDSDPF